MDAFDFNHVKLYPNQQIGKHQQTTWELSYVIKGKGKRIIGGDIGPFTDGDIVLVPPKTPHQWKFDEDSKMIENISIAFDFSVLEKIAETDDALKGVADILSSTKNATTFYGNSQKKIATLLKSMVNVSKAMRFAIWVEVITTIAESLEKRTLNSSHLETESERRLKQIEIFIDCNHQKEITVDDIAKHVGMNRTSLCYFYRKATGKTLFETITDYRIRTAKLLLESSGLPVQQVGYQSGFRDVPHFCRVFKKMTGTTPSAFRISDNIK